jgi:polar amino acid transport system substrate-binding protein
MGAGRAAIAALAVALCAGGETRAQPASNATPFFDLSRRPERAELTGARVVRFLTDDDYPPFHFIGPDGQLTGFNVDLALAICRELKAACTIQARRWDTLPAALEEGRGDAVIASLASRNPAWSRFDFSLPYYRTPARFAVRKDGTLREPTRAGLAGRRVGVVADGAHAAFLAAFHPAAVQRAYRDHNELLAGLAAGEVDAVFADGIGLSIWLNGETGASCCAFLGGPFYESRFFGEGAAIAFRRDGAQLRRAVDHALFRLAEQGVYRDLLLKYFPVAFY